MIRARATEPSATAASNGRAPESGCGTGRNYRPARRLRYAAFSSGSLCRRTSRPQRAESQYIVGEQIPTIGPARVVVGSYGAVASPVRAPGGINYLLVTLNPGEQWTYEPPSGHTVAWVAVSRGTLHAGQRVSNGELAIFDKSEAAITLEGFADIGATLVLGSAVPHPYPLHLGAYSVHTSAEALAIGERHIRELKARLDASGDRRTERGSTSVFRG